MQSQAEQPASTAAIAGPYDGVWGGRAKRSSGSGNCPATLELQVTVANEDVSGSISSRTYSDELTGKVDENGRLNASVSVEGNPRKFEGTFSDDRFHGTFAEDGDCRYAYKIERETD